MHTLEARSGEDRDALAERIARVFADPAVDVVFVEGGSESVLEALGFHRDGDTRWRRPRHPADGFLGEWDFDPTRASYEAGTPPRDGRYVLAPLPDGVAFTVDWTDPEGNARHVAFSAVFGEKDGLTMTREDARTLVTAAPAGPITHASRVLAEDLREMTIAQSGARADGTPFTNTAVYVRRAWWPTAGGGSG